MQMSKRVRGSVSVLLCLILLPMITYSTMIIDASRLQAVRTNISGAGDLTLNAMMSDYNYMLEEMYGLFANCTEKDDIEEALKTYFQQTIEGRFLPQVGRDGEYVQNLLDGVVDIGLDASDKVDSKDITDFLSLQLQSFTADPVAGSALANPATMKRQIIEYMKYRGPVSIASTLLGKLDYLSDSHSQVDACEKKVEYTKDLGKLQDPCIATYEAIESKYNPGALLTNEELGKGIIKDERDHLNEALRYSQQQFGFATAFYLMNTHSPFYKSASLEGGDYNDYGSFLRKAPQPSKSFSVNKDGAENDQAAIEARIQANLKSLDEIVQLLTNDTSSGYHDKSLHMNFENLNVNVHSTSGSAEIKRSQEQFNGYSATLSIDYQKSEYTDSDGKKYVYPNYELLDDTKPDKTLSKNGNTGTSYYQALKPFLDLNNYQGTYNINNERIKPDDAEVNKFYGLSGKSGQLDNSLAILKAQENLYKPMKNGIEYLANQHNKIKILTKQYDDIWDQIAKDVKQKFNKAVSDKKKENWDNALAAAQAEWSRRWREDDDWEDRRTAWEEERQKDENKDEYGNCLLPAEEPAPESMTESEMNDLGVTVATVNETDVWNETVNGLSMPSGCANDFNGLESNYHALNVINTQLDYYEGRINLYIERLAKHNDLYFGKYGQAYTENGYSQLLAFGLILKMMYKGLDDADKQMTEIMKIVKDLDTKAQAWQESVKNVNSDSTQAAMQSDYNTLAGQFKKDEVEKFQKLVGELKTQVKGMWDALQDVKYFGQSLFQIDSGTTTFISLKDKSEKEESGKKIEPGKNTYEIVEKLIKEGKVLHPIGDGDYFNLGLKGSASKKCDDSAFEIVAKAGEDMWGQITDNSPTVSFLNYKDHADIFGAEFDPDITDTNNAKYIMKVATDLVEKNYSPKTHGDLKHFQILDGIKDDYGCAPTRSDKQKAEVDKIKNDPSKKDFLDPNEAFMITLYTEAKAVKQEEARKQKEEQEKNADPNHKSEEDVVSDAAKEQVDESQKEPEDNRKDLDHEEIKDIMDEVSSYKTEYNEANKEGDNDYTKRMPEPTVGEDSDDGGSLAAAQEVLKAISDIATKVVDNLYLEEYFTEMFTCRTDNQMLNSLTAAKDKKVLPVVMLNGFHTESAVSSIAGDKQVLNDNTEWYGKEIEYLLWGSNDLNKNLVYTDAMIFAIRFALNAIYAFTAPDIQSYALELATAIAGWTVVGVPIVQVCITLLIALAESGYDLYLLHDGREVPIYKNQATFVCSPTGMLKKIATEVAVKVAEEVITSAVESVEDHLDAKIDELEAKTKDWANAKISDCKDSLNSVTEEYVDRQTEAVKEEIRKQFITPVLNKVIPLGSLAEISQMYSELKVDELVNNALNDKDTGAFSIIEQNIKDMAPGVVQEILSKLIDEDAEPFTVSVPNPLNPTEMTEYTVDCKKYYSELKETITTTITGYLEQNLDTENIMSFDLETKLRDAVDKLFETGKQSILALVQEKVNAAAGTITKAIDENLDKGAETAKSFMREKMDEATTQITGKLKESVTEHLDGLPEGKEIDTDASSGITLNYKEYCKIFMLLFVSFNQNQILQRAAVLITCNMRHVTPIVDDCGDTVVDRIEKYNLSEFTMTKANTMFSVSAQVNMMTLFPWPVADNMDETSTEAGLQFDPMSIRQTGVTINYCGMNGY